jgi:hypothetical protein
MARLQLALLVHEGLGGEDELVAAGRERRRALLDGRVGDGQVIASAAVGDVQVPAPDEGDLAAVRRDGGLDALGDLGAVPAVGGD